jgi:amidase
MKTKLAELPLKALLLLLFITFSCESPTGGDEAGVIASGYDSFEFMEIDISRLQQGYTDGDYTVTEVVKAYLARIDAIDKNGPALNSLISVNPDALAIAGKLDAVGIDGGSYGVLYGVPVVLKDNLNTHDRMPTTAGSRALMTSFPEEDSYVAQKLREAGAVIIGKANLSEWANFRGQLSSSGWSGVGGRTRNPYVLDRNPSGSSSGSGVAVSANLTVFAIGTETNGSIVGPSHANGIVGIKPTVGLISRSGIIPISNSLDTAGPMTRSVRDAAIVLGALVGIDSDDERTIESQGAYHTDYTIFLNENGLQGKNIGFFKGASGRNYKVDSLMNRAVNHLKSNGANIIEIDDISSRNTGSHSLTVMLFEYKDGLNKYFNSLGPDSPVKDIAELIAFNKSDSVSLRYFNQHYLELANEKGDLSSPEYLEALAGMLKGSREDGIDRVMDLHKLDAIIAPTGSPAPKTDLVNGETFQLGSSSHAAHAGYPSITLPMGYIENLPVGISFFGRAWSEPALIELAYAYEQSTKHRRVPEFLPTD